MSTSTWRNPDEDLRRKIESDLMGNPALLNGAAHGTAIATEFPRILDKSDPLACARRFIAEEFTTDDRSILIFHRGDFYRWTRTRYARLEDDDLRASLYVYCETAKVDRDGKLQAFKPSARQVSEVADALKAAAILPAAINPPAWIGRAPGLSPSELIPCANGLLDLTTMQLLAHDPAYFNTFAIDVAFDPAAPDPKQWLDFLYSLWGDDTEAIATLQEIFGYLLIPNTKQQKIFLIVGPKRSGKGTIARILTSLIGPENATGPTLTSLATNFGLAPLIGKQVAIIADARLSGRADQAAIAETLLNVSGEDTKTIDRKHRDAWTGTLPTRFVMLSNELPRLADSSGALASRFVVLTLTNSFLGQEDTDLTERLRRELPGIFNWSLKGLKRLQERGHFIQPASSAEAITELGELGSQVSAFLADCCEIGPGRSADVDDLFGAWRQWCTEQGRDHAGTRQTFGRDIRAAVPGLRTKQRREAYKPVRFYEGVGLA